MRLAKHRSFPFAGLISVMPPGDLRIVRRVVAAILYIVLHRIVDVLYHPAFYGQSKNSRQEALCHAVSRIYGGSVSPLGHDVAVTNDDAVCLGSSLGNRTKQSAKCLDLG